MKGNEEFTFREIYVGTTSKDISPKTIWKIIHYRWYIENTCFHQLKTYCNIDIQFIVSGVEKMSWLPIDKLSLAENDLAKSDKALYKDSTIGQDFIVHEGQFVIFYPEDGHKACIAVDEATLVKKIVLKVALN